MSFGAHSRMDNTPHVPVVHDECADQLVQSRTIVHLGTKRPAIGQAGFPPMSQILEDAVR